MRRLHLQMERRQSLTNSSEKYLRASSVHGRVVLWHHTGHNTANHFPSTTLAVMMPLRCQVHVIQSPTSSSSSVGVKQGYL